MARISETEYLQMTINRANRGLPQVKLHSSQKQLLKRMTGLSRNPPVDLATGQPLKKKVSSSNKRFVIPGPPCAKPRQTRADKWKKRPVVLKYRAWADLARACAGKIPADPQKITIKAFFAMPRVWPKSKNSERQFSGHRQRPDIDNLAKACLDALYPHNDSMIYHLEIEKRWDDGRGARVEVEIR